MRRIVLPLVAAADVCSIAAADVRISVEVVISVYVDVTTTPPAAPTPATAPGGAHGPTNTKRDRTGGDHRSR